MDDDVWERVGWFGGWEGDRGEERGRERSGGDVWNGSGRGFFGMGVNYFIIALLHYF